jgi:hypothetical protein
MKKLLEDLDGKIVLNQSPEAIINDSLKIYLNFVRGNEFSKRVEEEIKAIFEEKKSNKTYFFQPPKQNVLKSIGFNQIIHILIRRLWDEEDFFRITKNPSQISFISAEVQDIHSISISLSDVQKFISNQNVFPFISTGDISFFTRPELDQLRKAMIWIKSPGNSIQKFIERIRLIGAYIQTVFFAIQCLFEIAKDYQKEKPNENIKLTEIKKALSETEVRIVPVISESVELKTKIDYPLLVDILIYEIKNIFKNPANLNLQEALKLITNKVRLILPEVSERHTTIIYLILKETTKSPQKTIEDYELYFKTLEEKLKVQYNDIKIIFFLLKSEQESILRDTPLSEFVEECISLDKDGVLTELQVKILKSLFTNLPKEIRANHFYSVKEKLKLKMEDSQKKKIVDTLSEFIHMKIRELRTKFALTELKKYPNS